MRVRLITAVIVGLAAIGGAARGAPRLELKGLAARVTIVPEARGDIRVTVLKANAQLPVFVTRSGAAVVVDGKLDHRIRGCPAMPGGAGARIKGLGFVGPDALPRLVVQTPMDVQVVAGDAVSGVVGRANSLDFENRGCGDWTVSNVRKRLRFNQVGAGQSQIGRAGAADLSVDGGGSISTRAIAGPVTAVSSGEGEIVVDSVSGPLIARVAGSGGVQVRGGRAPQVNVSVAGSGAVRFGGVAGAVAAEVTGSGLVTVAHARGPVSRRVFGAGQISIGR